MQLQTKHPTGLVRPLFEPDDWSYATFVATFIAFFVAEAAESDALFAASARSPESQAARIIGTPLLPFNKSRGKD